MIDLAGRDLSGGLPAERLEVPDDGFDLVWL